MWKISRKKTCKHGEISKEEILYEGEERPSLENIEGFESPFYFLLSHSCGKASYALNKEVLGRILERDFSGAFEEEYRQIRAVLEKFWE